MIPNLNIRPNNIALSISNSQQGNIHQESSAGSHSNTQTYTSSQLNQRYVGSQNTPVVTHPVDPIEALKKAVPKVRSLSDPRIIQLYAAEVTRAITEFRAWHGGNLKTQQECKEFFNKVAQEFYNKLDQVLKALEIPTPKLNLFDQVITEKFSNGEKCFTYGALHNFDWSIHVYPAAILEDLMNEDLQTISKHPSGLTSIDFDPDTGLLKNPDGLENFEYKIRKLGGTIVHEIGHAVQTYYILVWRQIQKSHLREELASLKKEISELGDLILRKGATENNIQAYLDAQKQLDNASIQSNDLIENVRALKSLVFLDIAQEDQINQFSTHREKILDLDSQIFTIDKATQSIERNGLMGNLPKIRNTLTHYAQKIIDQSIRVAEEARRSNTVDELLHPMAKNWSEELIPHEISRVDYKYEKIYGTVQQAPGRETYQEYFDSLLEKDSRELEKLLQEEVEKLLPELNIKSPLYKKVSHPKLLAVLASEVGNVVKEFRVLEENLITQEQRRDFLKEAARKYQAEVDEILKKLKIPRSMLRFSTSGAPVFFDKTEWCLVVNVDALLAKTPGENIFHRETFERNLVALSEAFFEQVGYLQKYWHIVVWSLKRKLELQEEVRYFQNQLVRADIHRLILIEIRNKIQDAESHLSVINKALLSIKDNVVLGNLPIELETLPAELEQVYEKQIFSEYILEEARKALNPPDLDNSDVRYHLLPEAEDWFHQHVRDRERGLSDFYRLLETGEIAPRVQANTDSALATDVDQWKNIFSHQIKETLESIDDTSSLGKTAYFKALLAALALKEGKRSDYFTLTENFAKMDAMREGPRYTNYKKMLKLVENEFASLMPVYDPNELTSDIVSNQSKGYFNIDQLAEHLRTMTKNFAYVLISPSGHVTLFTKVKGYYYFYDPTSNRDMFCSDDKFDPLKIGLIEYFNSDLQKKYGAKNRFVGNNKVEFKFVSILDPILKNLKDLTLMVRNGPLKNDEKNSVTAKDFVLSKELQEQFIISVEKNLANMKGLLAALALKEEGENRIKILSKNFTEIEKVGAGEKYRMYKEMLKTLGLQFNSSIPVYNTREIARNVQNQYVDAPIPDIHVQVDENNGYFTIDGMIEKIRSTLGDFRCALVTPSNHMVVLGRQPNGIYYLYDPNFNVLKSWEGINKLKDGLNNYLIQENVNIKKNYQITNKGKFKINFIPDSLLKGLENTHLKLGLDSNLKRIPLKIEGRSGITAKEFVISDGLQRYFVPLPIQNGIGDGNCYAWGAMGALALEKNGKEGLNNYLKTLETIYTSSDNSMKSLKGSVSAFHDYLNTEYGLKKEELTYSLEKISEELAKYSGSRDSVSYKLGTSNHAMIIHVSKLSGGGKVYRLLNFDNSNEKKEFVIEANEVNEFKAKLKEYFNSERLSLYALNEKNPLFEFKELRAEVIGLLKNLPIEVEVDGEKYYVSAEQLATTRDVNQVVSEVKENAKQIKGLLEQLNKENITDYAIQLKAELAEGTRELFKKNRGLNPKEDIIHFEEIKAENGSFRIAIYNLRKKTTQYVNTIHPIFQKTQEFIRNNSLRFKENIQKLKQNLDKNMPGLSTLFAMKYFYDLFHGQNGGKQEDLSRGLKIALEAQAIVTFTSHVHGIAGDAIDFGRIVQGVSTGQVAVSDTKFTKFFGRGGHVLNLASIALDSYQLAHAKSEDEKVISGVQLGFNIGATIFGYVSGPVGLALSGLGMMMTDLLRARSEINVRVREPGKYFAKVDGAYEKGYEYFADRKLLQFPAGAVISELDLTQKEAQIQFGTQYLYTGGKNELQDNGKKEDAIPLREALGKEKSMNLTEESSRATTIVLPANSMSHIGWNKRIYTISSGARGNPADLYSPNEKSGPGYEDGINKKIEEYNQKHSRNGNVFIDKGYYNGRAHTPFVIEQLNPVAQITNVKVLLPAEDRTLVISEFADAPQAHTNSHSIEGKHIGVMNYQLQGNGKRYDIMLNTAAKAIELTTVQAGTTWHLDARNLPSTHCRGSHTHEGAAFCKLTSADIIIESGKISMGDIEIQYDLSTINNSKLFITTHNKLLEIDLKKHEISRELFTDPSYTDLKTLTTQKDKNYLQVLEEFFKGGIPPNLSEQKYLSIKNYDHKHATGSKPYYGAFYTAFEGDRKDFVEGNAYYDIAGKSILYTSHDHALEIESQTGLNRRIFQAGILGGVDEEKNSAYFYRAYDSENSISGMSPAHYIWRVDIRSGKIQEVHSLPRFTSGRDEIRMEQKDGKVYLTRRGFTHRGSKSEYTSVFLLEENQPIQAIDHEMPPGMQDSFQSMQPIYEGMKHYQIQGDEIVTSASQNIKNAPLSTVHGRDIYGNKYHYALSEGLIYTVNETGMTLNSINEEWLKKQGKEWYKQLPHLHTNKDALPLFGLKGIDKAPLLAWNYEGKWIMAPSLQGKNLEFIDVIDGKYAYLFDPEEGKLYEQKIVDDSILSTAFDQDYSLSATHQIPSAEEAFSLGFQAVSKKDGIIQATTKRGVILRIEAHADTQRLVWIGLDYLSWEKNHPHDDKDAAIETLAKRWMDHDSLIFLESEDGKTSQWYDFESDKWLVVPASSGQIEFLGANEEAYYLNTNEGLYRYSYTQMQPDAKVVEGQEVNSSRRKLGKLQAQRLEDTLIMQGSSESDELKPLLISHIKKVVLYGGGRDSYILRKEAREKIPQFVIHSYDPESKGAMLKVDLKSYYNTRLLRRGENLVIADSCGTIEIEHVFGPNQEDYHHLEMEFSFEDGTSSKTYHVKDLVRAMEEDKGEGEAPVSLGLPYFQEQLVVQSNPHPVVSDSPSGITSYFSRPPVWREDEGVPFFEPVWNDANNS